MVIVKVPNSYKNSNIGDGKMSLIESIIMGIIQGVTEFLPVSSSGHLAIFKNFFGLEEAGISFDILLHVGTLVAVFICFWKDIWELIVNGVGIIIDVCKNIGYFFVNLVNGKKPSGKKEYVKVISTPYRRYVMLIIIATIPTGIMGLLLKDTIEAASMALLVPGICLLITSVLLLIADNAKDGDENEETVSYKKAGIIGVCQGFATMPGISRSGTTITACLMAGMDRAFAVKFSFIVSIPAILGAAVLDLPDMFTESISPAQWANYVVGMAVSAIVGYVCIKTMLQVVRKKKFKGFSLYCAIIGLVAVIGYFVM